MVHSPNLLRTSNKVPHATGLGINSVGSLTSNKNFETVLLNLSCIWNPLRVLKTADTWEQPPVFLIGVR